MSDKHVTVPVEVIEFLRGAGPLEGLWFGESCGYKPKFWWREYLKDLPASPAQAPAPVADEREAQITGELRKNPLTGEPWLAPVLEADCAGLLKLGCGAAVCIEAEGKNIAGVIGLSAFGIPFVKTASKDDRKSLSAYKEGENFRIAAPAQQVEAAQAPGKQEPVTVDEVLRLLNEATKKFPSFATTTITATPLQLAYVAGKLAKRAPQPSHQQDQAPAECHCHKCATPEYAMSHMILCPICGNKRCPKASDHNLACTGSNEQGQAGSVYAARASQDQATGDGREGANFYAHLQQCGDAVKAWPQWKQRVDASAEPPATCAASRGDGECIHPGCPQLRDGEPNKSGRCCPLPDAWYEE